MLYRWAPKQLADPARLAIRGGSAGGFTTLAALTSSDVFGAGISLVRHRRPRSAGEGPRTSSRRATWIAWWDRIPKSGLATSSAHRSTTWIGCPRQSLLLQGTEDTVVPPQQAEMLADAARRKVPTHCLDHVRGRGARLPPRRDDQGLHRGADLFSQPDPRLRAGGSRLVDSH